MKILKTHTQLIIFMFFTLLTGLASAMSGNYNVMEEGSNEYVSYRDVFCSMQNFDERGSNLSDDEVNFCKKFLAQLLQSQELADQTFEGIQTQCHESKLILAQAKNDYGQLIGMMFFYIKNEDTEAVIKSLMLDNVTDEYLYEQLCLGMMQVVKQHFPTVHTIYILEKTVPQQLRNVLERCGLYRDFVNFGEEGTFNLDAVYVNKSLCKKLWAKTKSFLRTKLLK